MRELKFRVWWKDKTFKPTIYTEGDLFDDTWTTAEYSAIEQYTGLKDKNGKEIYEGDIIKYKIYPDSNIEYIDKVFFREESGAFMTGDKYNIRTLDLTDSLEAIGNIHENPELLEQGNAQN